jgi:hypothetical protein
VVCGAGFQHGVDNRDIASAAAQIAGQHRADARLVGAGLVGQQCVRGGQHARRAEPALQCVMLAKRSLQWRQAVLLRQPFDRYNTASFRLDGEDQARAHSGPVDDHRAGSAHAVLAADVGAGQPQRVTQAIG